MSKTKFKMNTSGVRELLQGAEMQTVLSGYASAIRDRCGNGYEQDIHVGKTRANAMVWPESCQAKRENKKNNPILKAVR